MKENTSVEVLCLAAKITLENGGETYRAEETVRHISRALGCLKTEVLAFPTGVTLTLITETGETVTRIVRVMRRETNLARIDRCNTISRRVSAGELSGDQALLELKKIEAESGYGTKLLLPAFAFSAVFFTLMLQGGIREAVFSLLCGVFAFFIKTGTERKGFPSVFTCLITSFVITEIALLGRVFFPELLIETIISGALMPLLPGLALTNAIRDTIRGDLVSGSARFTEAILCALTLGAGVAITLFLLGGQG